MNAVPGVLVVSLIPCSSGFSTIASVSFLCACSLGLTSSLALAVTLAATFEHKKCLDIQCIYMYIN